MRRSKLLQIDYLGLVQAHGNYMFLSDHASPQFEKKIITEPYKKVDHTFDVWVRPIWEWIESMLQDPQLIPHFVWDACQMSKFDGKSWVRVYDEPWTATRFWEIQVRTVGPNSCLADVRSTVKPPSWCKADHPTHLCRQVKVVLIRHTERLPSNCSVCKSSGRIAKWEWNWRWACRWLAPNCTFTLDMIPTVF